VINQPTGSGNRQSSDKIMNLKYYLKSMYVEVEKKYIDTKIFFKNIYIYIYIYIYICYSIY